MKNCERYLNFTDQIIENDGADLHVTLSKKYIGPLRLQIKQISGNTYGDRETCFSNDRRVFLGTFCGLGLLDSLSSVSLDSANRFLLAFFVNAFAALSILVISVKLR